MALASAAVTSLRMAALDSWSADLTVLPAISDIHHAKV